MALKEINVGGSKLLVEVSEISMEGQDGYEYTSKGDQNQDLSDRITSLVGALSQPVRAAFEGIGAEEWELEVNFGFSGEAGIPFISKAEANASVKVTAKWKKGA